MHQNVNPLHHDVKSRPAAAALRASLGISRVHTPGESIFGIASSLEVINAEKIVKVLRLRHDE